MTNTNTKLTGRLAQVHNAMDMAPIDADSVICGRAVGRRVITSLEAKGLIRQAGGGIAVMWRARYGKDAACWVLV